MKAIEELSPQVSTAAACRSLGVPRATLYRHRQSKPPKPATMPPGTRRCRYQVARDTSSARRAEAVPPVGPSWSTASISRSRRSRGSSGRSPGVPILFLDVDDDFRLGEAAL